MRLILKNDFPERAIHGLTTLYTLKNYLLHAKALFSPLPLIYVAVWMNWLTWFAEISSAAFDSAPSEPPTTATTIAQPRNNFPFLIPGNQILWFGVTMVRSFGYLLLFLCPPESWHRDKLPLVHVPRKRPSLTIDSVRTCNFWTVPEESRAFCEWVQYGGEWWQPNE